MSWVYLPAKIYSCSLYANFWKMNKIDQMDRIDRYIKREFNILMNKYLSDSSIRNDLLNTQKYLLDLTTKLKAEIKTKKKYGINVDFLSAEISRISLGTIENSYWLKGNISKKRPPGPTNSEISKLIKDIRNLLNEFGDKVRERNSIFISGETGLLHSHLVDLIKETFIIPNKNISFTTDLYDRNLHKTINFTQNTPCQICGENRVIDICHVIPAEMGGSKFSYNTIYLCPTHHRLFDRNMLTKEEWGKIDLSQVCLTSANFAKYVIKPQLEKFWKKIDNSNFELTTIAYLLDSDLMKSYEITIEEILQTNKLLNLDEIVHKSKIKRGYCIKILNKAIKDKKLNKQIIKGKTIYSKK